MKNNKNPFKIGDKVTANRNSLISPKFSFIIKEISNDGVCWSKAGVGYHFDHLEFYKPASWTKEEIIKVLKDKSKKVFYKGARFPSFDLPGFSAMPNLDFKNFEIYQKIEKN